METAKNIFLLVGGTIGVLAFVKGIIEFVHSNAIRRYEKFHQMSVRFDQNSDIQSVCAVLHGGASNESPALTKQQKEVFICFLEEIYFMMNSQIMKPELALYTFGYYGTLALESREFWQGLDKHESFYTYFLRFCGEAKKYRPRADARKRQLAY